MELGSEVTQRSPGRSGGYAFRPGGDGRNYGGESELTEPLLGASTRREEQIAFAAFAFENALEGLIANKLPRGRAVIRIRKIRHGLHQWRSLYQCAALMLGFTTLVESPLWCDNSRHHFQAVNATLRCPLPGGADANMSGLPILAPGVTMIIEALCMSLMYMVLSKEESLHAVVEGSGGGDCMRRAGLQPEVLKPIIEIMFLDLLHFAVMRKPYRFAPYGRLVLLFYWPRVVAIFAPLWLCFKEFANLVFMMLLLVFVFAWLLTMIVNDIQDAGSEDTSAIAGEEFATFSDALRSFFALMTGSGFPDIAITIIKNLRWSMAVFFPFILLAWFLFPQLLLAVVCETYQRKHGNDLETWHRARARGIAAAFEALQVKGRKGTPVITIGVFKKFLRALSDNPVLKRSLQQESEHYLFTALDDDGNGVLDFEEFFGASDLVLCEFFVTPKYSLLKRDYGWKLIWTTSFVESGRLDNLINVMLVVNGAFVLAESWMDIQNVLEPHWVEAVEQLFSMFYVVDVIAKLLVISWPTYWASGANRFDFVVTWLLFCAGFIAFIPGNSWVTPLVRYFNLIRIARLIKLLGRIDRFKKMISSITKLLKLSADLILLLLITDAFYAILGMQLFGGKLYKDNPDLQDSKYIQNGYYVFNFNGMTESIETMVSFTINNYQLEFSEALDIVAGFPHIGLVFCGSYFFFGIGISFNIFTAFTINIFMAMRKLDAERKNTDGREGDGDLVLEEDRNLKVVIAKCEKEGLCFHMKKPVEAHVSDIHREVFSGLQAAIDLKCSISGEATTKDLNVAEAEC